jgi:hypothetical protein
MDKRKKDAKPMEARPVISEISSNLMKNSNASETEEFKRLIASSPLNIKTKP